MKKLVLTLLIILFTLTSNVVWSADYYIGRDAYDSGDYATALREFKPLAEQGDADAQSILGWMYRKGHGVPQDDKTAVKWYILAAEQGDSSAQSNLGFMYRNGIVVIQNYKTALKWFRLAAEEGSSLGQANMGSMYEDGLGVIQDNIYAHMWANISASNGNEYGVELRDRVAKNMTSADISKAQNLARECVSKNYKGC